MLIDKLPQVRGRAIALISAVFVVGVIVGHHGQARPAPISVETIMTATQSVVAEPLVYPTGAPAKITAKLLTLQPGAEMGWHTHPIPTFGYVLKGEIDVDYGDLGRKTFRKGDALMEAMGRRHRGLNVSQSPVQVLAVFIGAEGIPTSRTAH